MGLSTGITLSGDSSATLSFDRDLEIVSEPALAKFYKEHKDAFTPDIAKSIEAVLDAADKNVAGPAMSLMMSSLHAPLSNKDRDFLLALDSSDALTSKVELKGKATVKSDGSMFPRTYYPCIKVVKIDFFNGDTLTKSLVGLAADLMFTCEGTELVPVSTKPLGILVNKSVNHKDEDRMASSVIV